MEATSSFQQLDPAWQKELAALRDDYFNYRQDSLWRKCVAACCSDKTSRLGACCGTGSRRLMRGPARALPPTAGVAQG
jgi:hypothetical protein